MPASQAARRSLSVADVAPRTGRAGALVRAGLASTLHRVRGGEGALLAINLSIVAWLTPTAARAVAQALVSALAIALMYAFNDLYDAPADWKNPKKARSVVATYLEHRRAGTIAILVLKLATVVLALALLDAQSALAVGAVMLVNLVYSVWLKGVPVADVAWCGVWGALYAAIVTRSGALLVLVGLMTAICHLFQTLGDRVPDAANGIITTAVRSPVLSRNVIAALSAVLAAFLYPWHGALWAASGLTPLVLFFAVRDPKSAWLLTKAYFAVVWLYVLGVAGAAG
jgi:4-hydroxybenzoate polyprenyltransferase